MKVRFSFTLKILLPYLLFVLLFLLSFLVEYRKGHSEVLWLSGAGMLFVLFFGIVHLFWLKRPLDRVSRLVDQLTRGNFPEFRATKVTDEIGDLERSLEKHVSNLKNIAAFSRSMASGDFTGRYEKLSNEDELGDALTRLKGSLIKSMEEAMARRLEEENSTWSAQGLAKFSSLFRDTEDNLQGLSAVVMKELVNYTEADVGALFITAEEEGGRDRYLEISGSYAFDREKQIHRSFKFGEGLVGRAALEKDLIYITDLPSDYMKIRSGLGEDAPSSILLVPVLLDHEVLGVIELASLGEIPPHQIDFVKQLAEALATTLAKVKANIQNQKLFDQTKNQAEALASQEKVFRKKMEQLETALERMQKKEAAQLKEIETLRKGSL
jgi:HAMP domain-containing protein/GAF domain-containing protein